jgi:aryl sulfotransferase
VIARLEARRERRVLKTHLPLDALPLYDQVRYIHVARDGRDAWASFYNHRRTYSAEMLAVFDRIGREDPELAAPLPRPDPVPREDFRKWLRVGEPGAAPGDLGRMDFFGFVRSFWQERDRTNIMLVHYNDMKADLATEMRRIAAFIGID